MLLFDTSGIEAYVTENNPKYATHIIKQLKSYAKANNFDDSYAPYKAAYSSIPSSAAANHEVKQQYVNGHFCCAYKFGILTNGLGIIDFYNRDYLDSHPDIVVEKKSKSPDEDKSLADSKALLPTLKDFKDRHPDIHPSIFLGDAAFDNIEIYKSLFEDFSFKKAFIIEFVFGTNSSLFLIKIANELSEFRNYLILIKQQCFRPSEKLLFVFNQWRNNHSIIPFKITFPENIRQTFLPVLHSSLHYISIIPP